MVDLLGSGFVIQCFSESFHNNGHTTRVNKWYWILWFFQALVNASFEQPRYSS